MGNSASHPYDTNENRGFFGRWLVEQEPLIERVIAAVVFVVVLVHKDVERAIPAIVIPKHFQDTRRRVAGSHGDGHEPGGEKNRELCCQCPHL